MAVEYLAGNRLRGTLAEMEALTRSNISDGSLYYATDQNKEYVFNSVDSLWRGLNDNYITSPSWSTVSSLSTKRTSLHGSTGSPDNAICMGGYTTGTVNLSSCEEWNGSSWSSGGSLSATRRALGGTGDKDSALCCGGYTNTSVSISQLYNGSTWSTTGSMVCTRYSPFGVGDEQVGSLNVGGYNGDTSCGGGTGYKNTTESFGGSTWTTENNISQRKRVGAGTGHDSTAIIIGGTTGSYTNVVESYNGTSWSSETNYPLTLHSLGASGTKTDCVVYGGYDGSNRTTSTYTYNGSTWTAGNSMNTAQASHAGGTDGTGSTGGITIGGTTATDIPTNLVQVYEY